MEAIKMYEDNEIAEIPTIVKEDMMHFEGDVIESTPSFENATIIGFDVDGPQGVLVDAINDQVLREEHETEYAAAVKEHFKEDEAVINPGELTLSEVNAQHLSVINDENAFNDKYDIFSMINVNVRHLRMSIVRRENRLDDDYYFIMGVSKLKNQKYSSVYKAFQAIKKIYVSITEQNLQPYRLTKAGFEKIQKQQAELQMQADIANQIQDEQTALELAALSDVFEEKDDAFSGEKIVEVEGYGNVKVTGGNIPYSELKGVLDDIQHRRGETPCVQHIDESPYTETVYSDSQEDGSSLLD